MRRITHLILHHSLTEDSETLSWQPIRRYHKSKGWDDVGYHYGIEVIDEDVEILIGRFHANTGAHCTSHGMNRRSLGIMFCGNFDNHAPSRDMWNKGVDLCVDLMRQYNIPVMNVKGHCEYDPYKTCPGVNFDLSEFRTQLELRCL